MKLATGIGYSGAQMRIDMDFVLEVERLGYDSIWTAEAYGSDAVTPLAYIAALTTKIKLGTSIMQMPGRTPAMCAMTMSTLDAISGGRALVGLGLSGPQVVEGWHGVPYGKPAARTREYVEILRKIWAREELVSYEGQEYQLPYNGPGATGLGKPLKSILHGRQLPVYLATMGPINIRNTAELADGWLPMGYNPETKAVYQPWLEEGLARAGRKWGDLAIQAGVQVNVTHDVQAALDAQKPFIALYVGGMGAKTKNFHKEMMARRGYPEAAERIQELFLAGRREEAIAAVPDAYVDQAALIGPPERIRERFRAWQELGVDGLTLHTEQDEALELLAKLAA